MGNNFNTNGGAATVSGGSMRVATSGGSVEHTLGPDPVAGFFGTSPIAQPTGVAATAAALHAALVSLGLITV